MKGKVKEEDVEGSGKEGGGGKSGESREKSKMKPGNE